MDDVDGGEERARAKMGDGCPEIRTVKGEGRLGSIGSALTQAELQCGWTGDDCRGGAV